MVRERPTVGLGRQRRPGTWVPPPESRSLHSAVLGLQRTAGNRAVLQLLRQPAPGGAGGSTPPAPAAPAAPGGQAAPTVGAGKDENELIITRPDGTRFHVRRRVRAQQLTRPGRPRAGFCHDDERVWLRIAWCEGTQGTIDAGANPQGALKNVLDTAVGQISNRASIDDVQQTLENATIQPFAEAEIASVGKWKISGDLRVDVSRGGLGQRTAGVKGDLGWIQVGVDFSDTGTPADGSEREKKVNLNVTVPLSKRTVNGKKCPERELAVWWDYDCLRETPVKYKVSDRFTIKNRDKLFLYFDYAKDTLRSDPKSGTGRLNAIALDRLDNLVRRGFNVKSINGYTSPEGRRGPPGKKDKGAALRWEGNDELSIKRANKAKELIKKRYRFSRIRAPIHTDTPAVGKTELPTLTDMRLEDLSKGGSVTEPWKRLSVTELEGDPLDAAILGPFRKDHPEETARLTDEDRAFVEGSAGTRKRAERMFENLRRVEINLEHVELPHEVGVDLYDLDREDECPLDIVEAAEGKWGSRIPFTKGDPPLCG